MINDPPRIDRRQFTQGLLAATAVGSVGLSTTQNGHTDDKLTEQAANQAAPDRPALADELLLLNLIVQRYPSEHYDAEVLRGIYGDLRGDVARGRILSEFPLKNSDEPCFAFRVYRGPE
jgi:hypothetical protein